MKTMPVGTIERHHRISESSLITPLNLVLLLMMFLVLLDPFYTGYGPFRVTRDLGPLKYFPLLFGLGVSYLAVVGLVLGLPDKNTKWRETIFRAWPLYLFSIFVLTGSLYARFFLDVKETFIQLALGVLGVPIATLIFFAVPNGSTIAKRLMQFLLLACPVVFYYVITKRLEGGQAFHTEMFLFVPLMIYLFLTLKTRLFAWISVLVFSALAVGSFKNTAFLILLSVQFHLLFVAFPSFFKKLSRIQRAGIIWVVVISMISFLSGLAYIYLNKEELLPSGNIKARSQTYEAAFSRFVDSPIVGNFYAESGVVDVGYEVLTGKAVVTHSDVLDILSHGGMVGFSMFAFGIFLLLKFATRRIKLIQNLEQRAVAHTLLSIVLCGLITSLFNSPLIMLPVSFVFWYAFGVLICMASATSTSADHSIR